MLQKNFTIPILSACAGYAEDVHPYVQILEFMIQLSIDLALSYPIYLFSCFSNH